MLGRLRRKAKYGKDHFDPVKGIIEQIDETKDFITGEKIRCQICREEPAGEVWTVRPGFGMRSCVKCNDSIRNRAKEQYKYTAKELLKAIDKVLETEGADSTKKLNLPGALGTLRVNELAGAHAAIRELFLGREDAST